jgi:hypothetical protein
MSKALVKIVCAALIILNSQYNYCQEDEFEATKRLFSKEFFQRHLNFLGSDLFEGRAPGTLGGNLSAKYLALEFAKLRIKPIGENNTYYQNIPFHSSKPQLSSQLKILYKEEEINFRLNDDFLFYQTGEPAFIPNSTPLVFVGYGIVAPEFDYNDYQNVDVEGKIVVYLDGEPASVDQSYFGGDNPTIYSSPEAKHRIALSRGAKGSILIPNTMLNPGYNWIQQVRKFSFPNLSLAFTSSTSFDIILNPDIADILFMETNYSLKDIFIMGGQHKMESFPLSIKLSFKGYFRQDDFISPNIAGMIDGIDPYYKDSYVLVTAHYDHLGIGPAVQGDSIYNGVFDNAAGVAALLEIARVISENNLMFRRSIIFLLTTGEESGLLGSYYYTQNPIVPLYKTVANINIDGIASFDNFKSIVGIGEEYSSLSSILKEIADERNLNVIPIPKQFISFGAYTKSDQHSFARSGIPSLLILDGNNYVNISPKQGLDKLINYSVNIYHSPFDDLQQTINYAAAFQHMEIILATLQKISNQESEPEWFSGTPYINARLISKAEKK